MVAIQMLYLRAMESLRTLRDEEDGQGLVEYALILFVVSIAVLTTLGLITGALDGVFEGVEDALTGVVEGG